MYELLGCWLQYLIAYSVKVQNIGSPFDVMYIVLIAFVKTRPFGSLINIIKYIFLIINLYFCHRSVLYYFEMSNMSLTPIALPSKVKIRDVSETYYVIFHLSGRGTTPDTHHFVFTV